MKIKPTLLVFLLGVCAWQASAQPAFDNSGDVMLYGTYYMRQVFYYYVPGQTNDLGDTINIQGNISFSGDGTYTFTGSVLDYAVSSTKAETFTQNGTYVISASGEGYISAVDQEFPSDKISGLVSHDIFIGSSSDNSANYNDLFICVPIGTGATNSTLSGSYTVAYFDPTFPGDALFTMTADGQGNIGTVNATDYLNTSTTSSTQTLSGVTYSFSNGAAQLKLGGKRDTSTLLAGTELLYVSPDGNFVFGGSYDGWDMFVGVRAATSAPSNYDGLYYQAGLDLDESATNSGYSPLDSYYGAFQASAGKIIGEQRLSTASPINYQGVSSLLTYGGSGSFTYSDSYTVNSDGSSDDSAFAQHYVSTSDGTIRIGYGIGPYLSLNVAVQAPALTGSGVYLNPAGVVNAASSAPFTSQVSPGEFLTLYGSGLAPTTDSASVPFPSMFHGVQVMINSVPAPIYYVSPTQISVVVPYDTIPDAVAQIYVVNNGANSNTVTEYTGLTSAGIFTNNPVGGLGYAAALHPDNSVISESSPAQIGETVAVYLAGLGAVRQPVPDGTAAPSNPLSVTTSIPLVFLLDSASHYVQAAVAFSGLAPGFAGLYQVNFTIPSGLVSGDASIEIIGQDSDTFQALLPVTATTSAAVPEGSAKSANSRLLPRHRSPAGGQQ
ncbi:MAG: hypothetical protein WBE37_06330 [Bryobacteraceae bacterium]